MNWKTDAVIQVFANLGYRITWTDLIHLDAEGNESYNVNLTPLVKPEVEE